MNPVYIAGRALASALGPDLSHALDALRTGGVPPRPMTVSSDTAWPVYALADFDLASATRWRARAQAVITQTAQQSGALADRHGPLFIASSSLDIGAIEIDANTELTGDMQVFADRIAGWLDWRGPVFTVSTACTSSLNAVLSAATLIAQGQAASALVLGIELPNRLTVAGFGAMQLLSADGARPCGAERNGLVLGQAVAALHLSSSPSRWRLAGGANVVDGRDPAGAVPEAVVAMCRQALAASGLQASDIGLAKPQAAGSVAGDRIELEAMASVFGPMPPLVSFKSAIGHTLGAAGAAELALLLACLETGCWPSTGYPLDPALPLSALNTTLPPSPRHVLASIIGFGGGHAAVVVQDTLAP
ncbi:MAG: hypothetical protein RLZZ618_1417 [Pseudomonadota bacterium]|jgi:3-oxoacyl-[acyl-carrier-protein] synthase-1